MACCFCPGDSLLFYQSHPVLLQKVAGDSSSSRYVVLDVMNYTEHEAELLYSADRAINVQPREVCRLACFFI